MSLEFINAQKQLHRDKLEVEENKRKAVIEESNRKHFEKERETVRGVLKPFGLDNLVTYYSGFNNHDSGYYEFQIPDHTTLYLAFTRKRSSDPYKLSWMTAHEDDDRETSYHVFDSLGAALLDAEQQLKDLKEAAADE